ncbi:MAG: tRNA (N(6)-L-threonylcarbamoyladenosine(37)-C(2))-methylthiotransferase [archaeon]
MNVFIQTYGCSNNQAESEIMGGLLARAGFKVVNELKNANLVIINSCVVKYPTVNKVIAKIKEVVELKKYLIIAGCLPEINLPIIKEIAPNASIVSTHNLKEIVRVTRNLLDGKKLELIGKTKESKLCLPRERKNKIIGIIPISSGCQGNCAYCATRIAKGNLFSFPIRLILKEIDNSCATGCKEIWITSQDNASYGLDYKKRDLPELLKRVLKLNHRVKIRIGMMNPTNVKLILKELIKIYEKKEIFKFLHIPIQAGSDKVLKLMRRPGNTKEFLEVIQEFRKQIPEITISTDIIVGFPGETNKDFQETINLMKKIKPDVLNISKYWAMPDTDAAKMKQVPLEISKKRAIELMKLHAKIALENNQKIIGKTYNILIDEKGFKNTWLGRNNNYKLIVVRSKNNLFGKEIKVRITEAKSHYLIGT